MDEKRNEGSLEIKWIIEERLNQKLREGKKPILDRLVVENTKDLLENLDRETLVKLRNLINEKLSS